MNRRRCVARESSALIWRARLVERVTPNATERELALKYALRELPNQGHYGRSHGDGPFRYDPVGCPGCRYAILALMQFELERRQDAARAEMPAGGRDEGVIS